MHKIQDQNSIENTYENPIEISKEQKGTSNNNNNNNTQSDILQQQNRRAEVLGLHSKGMTQAEIASVLQVDQSTVSRDLKHIKEESRKYIEQYVTKDIPFEFNRYLAGLDQITKKLWDIADRNNNNTATNKDRMAALSMLIHCYNVRLEMLIGGPDSNMNAIKHINEIKDKEKLKAILFLKL
jgi:DNA-binding CsgD family transcriptional regulator